ncbi:MAG: fibrinogen-like YCDxxxxGGGW domain-containing protein [Myxococcota bacterium]|nr:fibrinogen-like YCDxxxxGGGW domain-containing protein [Myxococcota bacterium]
MRSAVFGLLTGLLCLGCFEPPGEPCETAADCAAGLSCVTIEARSICLGIDAPDAGGLAPDDAGAVVPDASVDAGGARSDASSPGDGGSTGDAGVPDPRAMIAALGSRHSCAVTGGEAPAFRCFGDNAYGQLGVGDRLGRYVPVAPTAFSGVIPDQLALGDGFTCGVFAGDLWCWGRDPRDLSDPERPWQIALPRGQAVRQLAAGARHLCLLMADGTVACWGHHDRGQIGLALDAANPGTLVTVEGLEDVVTIAAGGEQSCAVKASGRVSCWGRRHDVNENIDGVDGSVRELAEFGEVVSLAVGHQHVCALGADGVMRCLGDNTHKQIDDQAGAQRPVTALPSLGVGQVPVSLHAAARSTCAVTQAGGVSCWGDFSGRDSVLPQPVSGLVGVDRLIASPQANHFCAVTRDEALWCWGEDDFGQLGRGRYAAESFVVEPEQVELTRAPSGGFGDPAKSCRALLEHYPERPSGQYQIDPDGDGEFTVHCDMELGDGGWTLVMLLDGQADASVTGFDGTIWDQRYQGGDLPVDLVPGGVSYRSPAYERLSFGAVSPGMRSVNGTTWQRLVVHDQARASLASVTMGEGATEFADSERPFEGRDGWCGLFAEEDAPICRVYRNGAFEAQGYNLSFRQGALRLGILASEGVGSCNGREDPNRSIYLGFGGNLTLSTGLRSQGAIQPRSNCEGYNFTHAAHGQIWVR